MKLLTSCHRKEPTGGTVTYTPEGPVYYNNVACLYLRMQRHHAAAHVIQKALPCITRSIQDPSSSVTSTGLLIHRYSTDIIYNTGLSLLLTDKPLEAFQCFEKLSTSFRSRPQLWVRMAECCIQYDLRRKEEKMKKEPGLTSGVVSKGRSRRLLLRYAVYLLKIVHVITL